MSNTSYWNDRSLRRTLHSCVALKRPFNRKNVSGNGSPQIGKCLVEGKNFAAKIQSVFKDSQRQNHKQDFPISKTQGLEREAKKWPNEPTPKSLWQNKRACMFHSLGKTPRCCYLVINLIGNIG